MERAVLELLGRHSNMALASCDADGTVTLRTPALERMLGGPGMASVDDVDALELLDSTGQRALGREEIPMARALAGETVIDDVLAVRRPDGHVLYLRCNAGPLRTPEGEIRGAMTLVQDVTTEWVSTLKQNELRDRLVTTINHELRTPLTKIIGHAELLLDASQDGVFPAPFDRSIQAVAAASQELAAMAERLTLLARLDEHTRLQPSEADVSALLQSVVQSEEEAARAAGVHVELAGPPRMQATIDVRSVSRATRELLANAIAHAPPASTVKVELHSVDGHFEICVTDRGPGIPASERARLTQPFERGLRQEDSTSSTGLGLALAGAVAAAHGGGLVLGDNELGGLQAGLRMRKELPGATQVPD